MAEFRLTAAAQRDLEAIFDYTVAHWGMAQATRYTDQIETICAALADAPQRAQACDDIRAGYRRQGVGQHVIYCKPTDYGIAVIRILHRRMLAVRHL